MRNHPQRLILLLAVAAMLTACAARRTLPAVAQAPAPAAPTIDVAALIAQGCYSCLLRAFAAAQAQNEPQLAFEAAALLAVRAKELGFSSDPWITQARALAGEDEGLRLIVEMVDAIPLDVLSGDRDATLSQTPGRLRANQRMSSWLAALKSPPGLGAEASAKAASQALRTYMHLALSCASDAPRKPGETAAAVDEAVRDLPVIRFRLGACDGEQAGVLRALRTADGEFVDADYALARYAAQLRPYPDLDAAVKLLQSAAAAFPQSPAIATSAGNIFNTIEAWTEGLASHDAALALVPDHPDALLGRTMSLSNLSQHQAAIASATRLIDGRWFRGQAFYWRAWNQFQLENYPAARADADSAKTQMINPGVFVLSGLIDWRMRNLEAAEKEFDQALQLDFAECEAASFLGGVRSERTKAPEALAAFKHAMQCYDLRIAVRRKLIATLEGAEATPAYKARETARHERAIEQADKRRAEAVNGIELLQKFLRSTGTP